MKWHLKHRILMVPIVGLVSTVFPLACDAVESTWTESTYEDFVDGTFDDSGANTYVSASGKIQTINRWDLNVDGFIDIVVSNTHPLIEALDLSLYWGNGKDFSDRRKTLIPVDGSQWSAPADFNGDGNLDLAIANYSNGTWTDMDSFVYYGGESTGEGWEFGPFNRKITLPTQSAQSVAAGDLNRDGHPDIVFAFSAGHWEYRTDRDEEYTSPSRVYWGDEKGFAPENYQDLPALGAADVAIADLNGDEWPEVIFANGSKSGKSDIDSYIYWGGEKGFSIDGRTGLPTNGAASVEVGDLDGDGRPDIVFANSAGENSFAYLNRSGGFGLENRIDFATRSAKDCAIADFDQDGHPDIFFTNHEKSGNRITESFLYYGGPEGFSNTDRMAFETLGAWGASAEDLNGDGWVDLLVSNYQEHYSYEVPSYVFWNSEAGFDNSRRTPLYAHGATGNVIEDFDDDGHPDLMIHSFSARSRGDYDSNYIYWGNEEGRYTVENRTDLPGRDNYEFAAADLDDNGLVDLVFANSGEAGRKANENWIYWNDSGSFSTWNLSGLPAYLSLGVQVADLDRNGWIDVIVCNFGVDPRTKSAVSYIYWGEADGFRVSERTEIPHVARACSIADLNGDSHLDLVFGSGAKRWAPDQRDSAVIYWGEGTRDYGPEKSEYLQGTEGSSQSEVADLDQDGNLDLVFGSGGIPGKAKIFHGDGNGGFDRDRSVELPVESSSNLSIADIDGNGWLDLVFPSYKAAGPPVSRSTQSRIYYNGPGGFSAENLQLLPTNSAAGTLVSDFNRDGFNDVFFYCHRQEGDSNRIGAYGDHLTDSYLYWGGEEGLDESRRDAIPTLGVHNDSGVDIGHLRDRGFEYSYVSSPHPYDGTPKSLSWEADLPPGTAVRFQLRFAESSEGLSEATWSGPREEGSFYTEPGQSIPSHEGTWIQYRALLDTGNGAESPVLSQVKVTFE